MLFHVIRKRERERETPTHEPITDSYVISISIFGLSCNGIEVLKIFNDSFKGSSR
jgi:hypothetical protein